MNEWYSVTTNTFEGFWVSFLNFLPSLVGAILIFVLGWFVAIGIGKLISGILHKMKFNDFFEGKGWKDAMDKAEVKVNPSEFFGSLVKWILIVVFLWIAIDILGFDQFAAFMQDVVIYLPNVIVAVFIFVLAVMLADLLAKIVMATTDKAGFPYSKFTGTIVKTSIWIFAIFAILIQLGIAREMILAIFYGLIALLALAGGLSFGIGGKDAAAKLIEDIKKKIK